MMSIFRQWMERYFADEEAVLLLILLLLGLVCIITMGSILAPFIASVIIAFVLQGGVNVLKRFKLPHLLSVSIVFVIFCGLLALLFLVLLPLTWKQLTSLVIEVPRILSEWQTLLLLLPEKYPDLISSIQIEEWIGAVRTEFGQFGQKVLTFSVSQLSVLFGVMIYVVLVPILVFFF